MTIWSPAKDVETDPAVVEWRRKAAGTVIAAGVILHLPPLAMMLFGQGPTLLPLPAAILFAAYGVTVAGALWRRVDYRARVWAMLGALYLITSVGAVALPQGPYIRALPITAPMFAIALIGIRAARAATLLSALVLLSVPLLRAAPGLIRGLGLDPRAGGPPGQALVQSLGLAAEMLILMILLERFYRFLLQALQAQRRAAAERSAAHRKLQAEHRERTRLEREITLLGEEERRRLGAEVHDGICQQLTGALLRCEALKRRLERGGPAYPADIGTLSSLLGETIDEARAVAQGLCPLPADPGSLAPALRALVRKTRDAAGVPCEFREAGDVEVPDAAVAHHLYRIAQEALSNAVRHARPGRIVVALSGGERELTLQVEDDGVGFPARLPDGGMGLRSMDSRARIIEGVLTVAPGPGGGTRIVCRVPRAANGRPDDPPRTAGRETRS